MLSKLPRWVWLGAWFLAFTAGVVNVVNLLAIDHRAVSHMTGNTSALAMALAGGDWKSAGQIALTIGAFFLGAILSGMLIQDGTLRLGRRYGVSLLIESILLFSAVPLLQRGYSTGTYLSAMACGLQNAMVSLYSGTIVRTTHLTGVYTDLGTTIGHLLRGLPVDPRRFWLFSILISGFMVGGIVGGRFYTLAESVTLLLPASLTSLAAAGYYFYRRTHVDAQHW